MPLPLRADPGCDADLAVRLHLDLRAFVRPDAGALDIARDADTDVPALRAQFRLLVLDELCIADGIKSHIENRLVVAAIVFERFEILVDDFVLVGEGTRWNQLAPPDLGGIDIQLMRGQIE